MQGGNILAVNPYHLGFTIWEDIVGRVPALHFAG